MKNNETFTITFTKLDGESTTRKAKWTDKCREFVANAGHKCLTFLDVKNNSKNVTVIDLTKKENNNINGLTDNEKLVNQFDSLFYNIENIDIQNTYLRDVLRLVSNNNLKELIEEMKREKNDW